VFAAVVASGVAAGERRTTTCVGPGNETHLVLLPGRDQVQPER